MEANHPTPRANELRRLLPMNEPLASLLAVNPSLGFRTLRAVLHTVRDQLDFEQSLQLLNQLPLSLKTLYVDHWDIQESTIPVETLDGLVTEVEKKYPDLMRELRYNRLLVSQTFTAVSKLLSGSATSTHGLHSFAEQSDAFRNRESDNRESSIWLP